jgi:hypothetical protein
VAAFPCATPIAEALALPTEELSHETTAIASREYKVMLRPARFAGDEKALLKRQTQSGATSSGAWPKWSSTRTASSTGWRRAGGSGSTTPGGTT